MKKLLTILIAVALGLNLSAQVPDYVPTDGLVAWYPFNGNANDESGNGFNGDAHNTIATIDRNGFEDAALKFNGIEGDNGSTVVIDHLMLNIGQEEYTIHLWFRPANLSQISRALFNTIPHTGIAMTFNNNNSPSYVSYLLGPADAMWNYYYVHGPFNDYQTTDWYALTLTKQGADYKKYINGVLESAFSAPLSENYDHDVAFRISGISADWQIFDGDIDDVGFWNRALTEEEILGLYNAEPPISGCTDLTACNFDSEATSDDGSCNPSGCMETDACNYNALAECDGEACDYTCCPGPGCCGEGTNWNSLEQTCESIPCETILDPLACGAGTFWDETTSQCLPILTCQEDLDGDGVIGVEDLMQLLSSFGTMCEDSEPETGEFTCGDPMNYHGYDYATVQIGGQCWFAENLRTELYQNGDVIPSNLSDGQWSSTNSGAVAVYGEGDSNCFSYSPDGDACDESWSFEEYGLLYNWLAVDDTRGLCPSGWKVPSDLDWKTMEMALGMSQSAANNSGWRGTDEGIQMKTTYGWANGGNGSNSSGFSGMPGDYRKSDLGTFNYAGLRGFWWSSSPSDDTYSWSRGLFEEEIRTFRYFDHIRSGFSVRCIKDTEE